MSSELKCSLATCTAPSRSMGNYEFILVPQTHLQSQRQKELDESTARSHASRAAYQRKKLLQMHAIDEQEPQSKHWQVHSSRSTQVSLPVSIRSGHDPFQTYAGAALPAIILEANEFNIVSYCSSIFNASQKYERGQALISLQRMFIQLPHVFHAQATIAAGFIAKNISDTRIRQRANMIFLEQQDLTFQTMQVDIATNPGLPSDGLILAALSLAIILGEAEEDVVHIHPASPFAASDLS